MAYSPTRAFERHAFAAPIMLAMAWFFLSATAFLPYHALASGTEWKDALLGGLRARNGREGTDGRISMFSAYRKRFGTVKAVLVLGCVYLASQVIIGSIIHDMGPLAFLKAQTTFSRTSYVEQVKQWQDQGLMDDYRRHFYFDFVHPLWYALFLSAFMAAGFNRNRLSQKADLLLCLPFIAGAMDLIENCFHVRFISDVDTISPWMIVASASAANSKWILAGTSIVIGLVFVSRRPREDVA